MTTPRVHEWFGQRAQADPHRTAIEYREKRLTYADLDRRANVLANRLLASGAGRGAKVAILADDVTEVVAAILASLKAGAIFVPFDRRIPERQMQAMAAETSIDRFVGEAAHVDTLRAIGADAGRIIRLDETGDDATPVSVERDQDDCCYIYFTSGSTGRPKGIAGRLRAIDQFVRWEIKTFGLGEGVRVSQLTTPSFDASLRDFFAPLCAGGTMCAPDSADLKLDAERLIAWIDRARIEVVHCVPSVFRSMLNEGLDPKAFASLRHVLMAGEPILPSDIRRWREVYGDRVTLVNLYGPSETTMTKFFHVVKPSDADRASTPIGVPMEGAGALVVDENNRPCPRGVVGEIWIRTPYRSLGYYGRQDLTDQVFIPNPFGTDPKDLVYKTGDLGRVLADGSFELVGRKDHQVKIRGERIELGAVEAALRRHPAVADVAVVDRSDAGDIKYLGAYVVLREPVETTELRALAGRELTGAAVPAAFVVLDSLPRNVNGKVDRRALPAPDERPVETAALEPPRTETEEKIAALFAEVLVRPRVGIHQNFFDLGGHSLLATQLVSRVRKAFGVDLPVRALFDAPTVAGLAEPVDTLRWVAQAAAAPASAAVTEIEL